MSFGPYLTNFTNLSDVFLDFMPYDYTMFQIALLNCDKAFTYDFAFDMFAPQRTIFDNAVDPLITNLFKGMHLSRTLSLWSNA